jgi:hypothetical protein
MMSGEGSEGFFEHILIFLCRATISWLTSPMIAAIPVTYEGSSARVSGPRSERVYQDGNDCSTSCRSAKYNESGDDASSPSPNGNTYSNTHLFDKSREAEYVNYQSKTAFGG